MAYNIIRLGDMYEALGEEKLKNILNDFDCHLNKDVDYFLKEKAIEFYKADISQTFIVTTSYQEKQVIVGYFSIANKVTKIRKYQLNAKWRKRISRFAVKDELDNKYFTISLPLIGQLGKNYKNGYNQLIEGDVLLKLACNKVKEAQNILGGKLVYLECEDKEKLIEFYENNGFVCFGRRNLDKEEREKNSGQYLLQMLCYLKD